MDWEQVNVWTSTLYTLVLSLSLAREQSFGDLMTLDSSSCCTSDEGSDGCRPHHTQINLVNDLFQPKIVCKVRLTR